MSSDDVERLVPPEGPRWRGVLRRTAVDISPLRESPAFRRLWLGEAVSLVGTQVTLIAVPIQVYDITGSSFAVGLLGLASLVPLIVFGLIGGAIADAVDRRRLLLATQGCMAAVSVCLVAQAAVGNTSVVVLYLLVGALSALFAIDSPARRTVTPRLIRTEQIPAATALGQVLFNAGVVAGPLLGGAIVAGVGFAWAYALDAASFLVSLAVVSTLPPLRPEGGGRRAGVASVVEGLRFLRTRRNVLMTFLVDINAMVFGMPRALFPAMAVTVFDGGSRTAGLLYASPAIGALAAALVGGWLSRVRWQGRAVLLAVAAWGAAIVGFGLTETLWLACVLLAAAGAADMVSAVFRTAILQAATPDAMRGRLSGIFIVVVAGGPRLGDLEAGTVAALTSLRFSVVSGGVACLLGVALLAALVPSFARYDARDPQP